MSKRLQGKIVLNVGGARGIGAAESKLFAQEGATVFIADLLDDRGEALARSIREAGGDAQYLHLDARREEDWAKAIGHIDAAQGKLDVLVNNVGTNDRNSIMATTLADWNNTLETNATTMFLGIRSVVPLMRKAGGGSIINIGSTSSVTGTPYAAYSSSKWAMRGLGKIAAREFVGEKIRVNTVCPGFIENEFNAGQPYLEALRKSVPLGRAGSSDEVAHLSLYLATDEAAYVTGQDIVIDGALSMPSYVLSTYAGK
ncbi:SDR family NAD(P)-dependent oxidoreductase [Paraburkholderia acidisoli]|uniref:SDR family oxidoreductase n=1 Tax=Paraburkholderia acidisoli TaxID=2571748 RepID=A0A7Z2GPF1_9BURK|nr:SDR family NAD(P)-dependent oxidoreductase [Paraburkholderia acidisoli]QGZ65290.1 SDR family oxidoreductase [Paraburkholderia acidisoli]